MSQKRNFKSYMQDAMQVYGTFNHAAHLHVTWAMLRDMPALDALARFSSGLRAVAQSTGNAEKYNETLTVAWFILVLERLDRGEDWATFAARNPDLFDVKLLAQFYAPDVLRSDAARLGFIMPQTASQGLGG